MADATKLLPCPMCGGEAALLDYEARYGGLHYASRCPQCASCGCSMGYLPTAKKAVEAWNCRASMPAPEKAPSFDDARRKLIHCIEQWDGETEYDAEDIAALADDILDVFASPPTREEAPGDKAVGAKTEGVVSRDGYWIDLRWMRFGAERARRLYDPLLTPLSPALADLLVYAFEEGRPVHPKAPAEGAGDERTIDGETVLGFKVAAWRYQNASDADGAPYGYRYCEHWSTPGNGAKAVERLFTETQLRDALRTQAPDSWRPTEQEVETVLRCCDAMERSVERKGLPKSEADICVATDWLRKVCAALRPQTAESGK